MIKINNIKINRDNESILRSKIEKIIGVKDFNFEIYRKSIDARKGIVFNYQVLVDVNLPEKKISKIKDASYYFEEEYILKKNNKSKSILIVGDGPSGLFAAYNLSKYGIDVTVIERGEPVDDRIKSIEKFFDTGKLNQDSNVQYGEGGAGTFSDGKLTARSKDKRLREVLKVFVENGAPKEIMYDQKPHIGTDLLREIIKNMRIQMESRGVKFLFNTKMIDLETSDGKIEKIITNRGIFTADEYVFALGNSARDTFFMLEPKIKMSNKPFAVGFRIEHKQEMIDLSQYHVVDPNLPRASYSLTYSDENKRGVYTFCMCPGGYVINASSTEGELCVNGMSYHARDGVNSNSAIVCGIDESTYGNKLLDGVRFQIEMEKKAFNLGESNFSVPIQRVRDFIDGVKTEEIGEVIPTVRPQYIYSNLREIYPEHINNYIANAIIAMGKRLKGFDMDDAVLTGIETRTSCPIRLDRDENMRSVGISNLFCIGEGAGYAGGIVSSAIDGLKCGEIIITGN